MIKVVVGFSPIAHSLRSVSKTPENLGAMGDVTEESVAALNLPEGEFALTGSVRMILLHQPSIGAIQ